MTAYIQLVIKDEDLFLKLKRLAAETRGITLIEVTEEVLKKGLEYYKLVNL